MLYTPFRQEAGTGSHADCPALHAIKRAVEANGHRASPSDASAFVRPHMSIRYFAKQCQPSLRSRACLSHWEAVMEALTLRTDRRCHTGRAHSAPQVFRGRALFIRHPIASMELASWHAS